MPTFYDRFVECAERWPQNLAVEVQRPDGIESYSYAQLRRMAEAIGASLLHRGLDPGARVAILADNHPRWVAAYLGIIAAGGTTVPLDTAYHADQVAKLLLDRARVALVPGDAFGAPGYLRLSYATSIERIDEGLRRLARFFRVGHTPGKMNVPGEERNPNFPFTLDLRRA